MCLTINENAGVIECEVCKAYGYQFSVIITKLFFDSIHFLYS